MTEGHHLWGVFFTDDYGRTYLVAVHDSKDAAIERAWELDEGRSLDFKYGLDLPNLYRVAPISEELSADADEPLSRGEPMLVWAP